MADIPYARWRDLPAGITLVGLSILLLMLAIMLTVLVYLPYRIGARLGEWLRG